MSKPPCDNYKSTLVDTVITVKGSRFDLYGSDDGDGGSSDIKVTIKAYELTYGPVIDLTIKVNIPYTSPMNWSDHPFMYLRQDKGVKEPTPRSYMGDIIDDTPAVRAILTELAQTEPFKLYTTTDCTHRAALIASLEYFWS